MAPLKKETIWLKRVLIPFWVLRILFEVILIGLYAFALSVGGREINNQYGGGVIAIVVVYMVVLLLVLILDIVAIVKFSRHKLKPRTFLIFNVIQTTIWLVILILEVISAVRYSSASGTILGVIIFLCYLALLIYASVIYHRHRMDMKRGHYAPASNPNNPANPFLDPPQQSGTHYSEPTNFSSYAPYGSQQPHAPPIPSIQLQPHPPQPPQVIQPPQPMGAAADYYQTPPAYDHATAHHGARDPPVGYAEIGPSK